MNRLHFPILAAGCLVTLGAGDGFDPGPAPGAALPPLGLPDQTGRERNLADLTGPDGLLLLVFRSADW